MNINHQLVIKLCEDTHTHHEHIPSASHQTVQGQTQRHHEHKPSASHQAVRGHTQTT